MERPAVYPLAWQEEIVRTIFGVIGADGYRQFKQCYITVAKKQGKTMLAAALSLYLLLADNEEGAEIYSCAADRAQAALIYRESIIMAQDCPSIARRVKIVESQKQLVYPRTNSFYQVLSSEAYSHHGLNAHAVLFDETHVADREMFRVMTQGSSDARKQPLHLFISTAGNDIHSVGYELHQKAKDIAAGRKIDSSFLPVIYALEEGDDWMDENNWYKANPSLGTTVSLEAFKRAAESARQNPAEENSFRQLRCNQWVKQEVRWMPMRAWDACNGEVNADALKGRACYGGLDLSATIDVTALVLVFPPAGAAAAPGEASTHADKYIVLPFFWLPEETIAQRVRRDHVPYGLWQKQGLVKTTEGNVVDYSFIEQFIYDLGEEYNIREIAYDPWNCENTRQRLDGRGFTMIPFITPILQSAKPLLTRLSTGIIILRVAYWSVCLTIA